MVANQERFMEILTGLFEFAQSNGGVLEKSKVEESFSEMELSREQYDLPLSVWQENHDKGNHAYAQPRGGGEKL